MRKLGLPHSNTDRMVAEGYRVRNLGYWVNISQYIEIYYIKMFILFNKYISRRRI